MNMNIDLSPLFNKAPESTTGLVFENQQVKFTSTKSSSNKSNLEALSLIISEVNKQGSQLIIGKSEQEVETFCSNLKTLNDRIKKAQMKGSTEETKNLSSEVKEVINKVHSYQKQMRKSEQSESKERKGLSLEKKQEIKEEQQVQGKGEEKTQEQKKGFIQKARDMLRKSKPIEEKQGESSRNTGSTEKKSKSSSFFHKKGSKTLELEEEEPSLKTGSTLSKRSGSKASSVRSSSEGEQLRTSGSLRSSTDEVEDSKELRTSGSVKPLALDSKSLKRRQQAYSQAFACLKWLNQHPEALKIEGIVRVSADQDTLQKAIKQKKFQEAIDKLVDKDVHIVIGILKKHLRDNPMITKDLVDEYLKIKDSKTIVDDLQAFVKNLSHTTSVGKEKLTDKFLLKEFIHILNQIIAKADDNKMNRDNVVISLGMGTILIDTSAIDSNSLMSLMSKEAAPTILMTHLIEHEEEIFA